MSATIVNTSAEMFGKLISFKSMRNQSMKWIDLKFEWDDFDPVLL